ncbi:MAG: response regulator [Phycisphaerales bacterium]|nr:response regulator [Phycisphaerales bacterium]
MRLPAERIAELIGELDAEDAKSKSRRAQARFPFQAGRCVVALQHPGSATPQSFDVPTRNLSASGMSFLHGGYVHSGSACSVELIGLHGTWTHVSGIVVRCQYVQEGVYDVGLKFNRLIAPEEFCRGAVSFTVLLVEDCPATARIHQHVLEQFNAKVQLAANGLEAVDLAAANRYDAILMDMDLPVMDGLEATRRLRANGYHGLIVAATGMDRPEDQARCLQAGCDAYVAKPINRRELETILGALKREPLFSSLEGGEDVANLVAVFVDGLPDLVRSIESAFVRREVEELARLAKRVRNEAGVFGFAPLSEQAGRLESLVRATQDLSSLTAVLRELTQLCGLTRRTLRSSTGGV